MAIGRILLAVGVISLAVFVAYPPPPLSERLQTWKQEGQYLKWKGYRIFYIDIEGSGEAGTVVCLHGFPTSSFDWIKILPDLKKDFNRIVMLDFLGFGFSDKPRNITYQIGEQADIVEYLASTLKVKSTHILSHDYGDTVALEMLARHNIQKLEMKLLTLSMLNGGVFPDTHHPRPIQKLLLTPAASFISHFYSYVFFCHGFGAVFGSNQPTNQDFEDFWAALRYNDGDRATPMIINFLRERQEFKERWVGALKSTQLKVLMIYGPADPVNPPEFASHFRRVVPSQKIVTLDPSVGHYPQWEDPRSVSQALHKFITSL